MRAFFICFLAYIRSNQIMGWGEKAIEIRSVETGHLDGVFMHKRAQRLKFLCERNDKVSLSPSLSHSPFLQLSHMQGLKSLRQFLDLIFIGPITKFKLINRAIT